MFLSKMILSLLLLLPFLQLTSCSPGRTYHQVLGFLCIRPDFTIILSLISSKMLCSSMCSREQRCQAFTMADGLCQLFVFDKCSKSVRDCSCSRRGQVFVKQQPGLEAGQLCPTGYGDDLCGVKYKLLAGTGNWSMSRQKCESESGLVIMADVTDATEMSHIELIYSKYSAGVTMWLGGLQPVGSLEPAGGWYWVGCNISVKASLWNAVEPDNFDPYGENVIGRFYLHPGLSDFWHEVDKFPVLCECVSPFN